MTRSRGRASTYSLDALPLPHELLRRCKALALLDQILEPEREFCQHLFDLA